MTNGVVATNNPFPGAGKTDGQSGRGSGKKRLLPMLYRTSSYQKLRISELLKLVAQPVVPSKLTSVLKVCAVEIFAAKQTIAITAQYLRTLNFHLLLSMGGLPEAVADARGRILAKMLVLKKVQKRVACGKIPRAPPGPMAGKNFFSPRRSQENLSFLVFPSVRPTSFEGGPDT